MNKFKHRKIVLEIIDDFNWSGKELDQCLEEIEWINKNLGGTNTSAYPVLSYIQKNLRKDLKIADIGCGSGDLLKTIQSACEGVKKVELIGLDANKNIIEFAEKHFLEEERAHINSKFLEVPISFVHADVIHGPEQIPKSDIYIMNLFLHHFEENEIKAIMDNLLAQNPALIVINDLQRSKIAYILFSLVCKIKNFSFVTFNDGRLSILKGFNKNEMKSMANMAKGYRYTLKWRWAFRWQLILSKN